MRARHIVLLVAGVLLGLIGLGLIAAGGTLLWAHQTQRDDDGFFTTRSERIAAPGFAVVSEQVDLRAGPRAFGWPGDPGDLLEVRVRARAENPGDGVFVGIGPADRVADYLDGVSHSTVDDIDVDPFRVRYREQPGSGAPAPPAAQDFWAVSAQGAGAQAIRWPLERGRWVLVVMNQDATSGVAADVAVGARVGPLAGLAIGLLVFGIVLAAIGGAMTVLAVHRGRAPPSAAAAGAPGAPPGAPAPRRAYPLHLEGEMDERLSRGLWLVKWLLLIPHLLVLMVLWVVFTALTVVAFFAIVFTGRYPRAIFDINVGIMRWSWRVGFYGYSALGTDRYPRFSLAPDDHPATLEVEYPERLSRGLVWVKWWLLAIPHYILISIFGSGLWWSGLWVAGSGWNDFRVTGWSGGLIGVLVVFAAIGLLFAARYPRGLFDLVLGLNRWVFRVIAYVSLMTDQYPPFRLDLGSREARSEERTD